MSDLGVILVVAGPIYRGKLACAGFLIRSVSLLARRRRHRLVFGLGYRSAPGVLGR